METLLQGHRATPSRDDAAQQGLHHGRAADARARHRRDDGGLFGRLRRAAAAAAVSGAPTGWSALSEEHPGAISPLRAPMLSNLTYHAWSAAPRTVDAVRRATDRRQYTVTRDGDSSRLDGADVTPSLFADARRDAGARPVLSRRRRRRPAARPVTVLSDRGWRERFNADPSIVGRGVDDRRQAGDDRRRGAAGVSRFPTDDALLWMPLP